MNNWSQELAEALQAAEIASKIILAAYGRLNAAAAAPANVTTQTDRDSQEAILQHLAAKFPRDAFRAEEATPALAQLAQTGRRLWVIDPIDGTRGFVTKNGEFSVMIALAVNGIVVVGVVAEPAKECVTFAAEGRGCRQRRGNSETNVHVSSTDDLAGATLIQSHTKLKQENNAFHAKKVIETYSAGVKLARVADGSADLYVCDYQAMNDWDLAAGHVLVTEAGGRVTNLAGESRVYGKESPKQFGGLLATNGKLHEGAIARLR